MSRIPLPTQGLQHNFSQSSDNMSTVSNSSSPAADTRKKQSKKDEVRTVLTRSCSKHFCACTVSGHSAILGEILARF